MAIRPRLSISYNLFSIRVLSFVGAIASIARGLMITRATGDRGGRPYGVRCLS